MKYLIIILPIALCFQFSIATAQQNENYFSYSDSTGIINAFFGLDNGLPSLLCNQLGSLLDGMPVNFKFPLDASSLSETDFEVLDSLGNIHTPICAYLAPANENGENRTVLLLGEFGTAVTNPPVEVRVVDDLFTIGTLSGESACSEIINLNGTYTTNVVPLGDGPSLFFAQKIEDTLNECTLGIQTIQVAWNGGITPYINGDTESDLFQYYIGYSDSSGVLIPHLPISIADINDNDNFHQLCFSTSDEIVSTSMMANTVEDPNGDPNLFKEINVSYCMTTVGVENTIFENHYKVFPNPFSNELYIDKLKGHEYICIYDFLGQQVFEGKNIDKLNVVDLNPGVYFLIIQSGSKHQSIKLIKQ